MKGSGSSLFSRETLLGEKKTNMATVSRLYLQRFPFSSRTFSRMGSNHRHLKEKIAILKLFWKYLIVKTCPFLWTICFLVIMRVGGS